MKYFKKLVGEKIYLSPVNTDDAEKYVKWLSDFNVTDGIGRSGQIFTVENEKQWLEETAKKGDLHFGIVNLENDELIGNCGIHDIDYQRRTATVGIFIGEDKNRNHGMAQKLCNCC